MPLYYNWRSLTARRLSTALTVLGLGLVVFVFTAVLMLANGIESALEAGGNPRNVIVLREGATGEITSSLELEAFRALSSLPEVALSYAGEPLAAGERVVIITLDRAGGQSNVSVRGTTPRSFEVRPDIELVEGRAPSPGTFEVAVGSGLLGRFSGANVGGELHFAGERWPVVGRFAARGSAYESEVWGDVTRIGAAFDRSSYSAATFRLRDSLAVNRFIERVQNDPRFDLKAQREDLYWHEQSTSLATFIRVLGFFVSLVFSLGAALGAMITMYAQVANRVRELATLRALGFRRRSVLASMVVESSLLGLAGGVLGAVGGFAMRWVDFRTLNFETFSEVRFEFTPTAPILLGALLFGTALGLAGGLLPALRAARLAVVDAINA